MEVSANLGKTITYLGRVDYPKMYAEIEQVDFIIAGLDPFCERQYQYLVDYTTENEQVSLGFLKPTPISCVSGEHSDLSDNSTIIYVDNELLGALECAIKRNGSEYRKVQTAVQLLPMKFMGDRWQI
jgi:hypothetical protein